MNDRTTPNDDPSPSHDHPQPEHIEMNGGGNKKLWMLVVGFGGLAILIIALLLPALGTVRVHPRSMMNTTQLRGIVQGMAAFSSGNSDKLPGLDSKGYIVRDGGTPDSLTGNSGHGATVEARFWIMLDANLFGGNYAISPSETKTVWTTGSVTSDNYSYALLNLHSDGALPEGKTRPDQAGRTREWKPTIKSQAVLVADRARIPGGHIGDNYDKIYSIHTTPESEQWKGSIGWSDTRASFEREDPQDTAYGSAAIEADRLFAIDQDSHRKIDKLTDPNATWDKESNALLGYTSVGYEDDDIASE